MSEFKYHFQPREGWMNDPNGLCRYNGEYHAFFQFNPYSTQWDRMHWGHAVSKDLISWRQLSPALVPDTHYENTGGCFSGSSIEKDGKLYLFYTGVSAEYLQSQCGAVSSDGLRFEKFRFNPIIKHDAKLDNGNFRDPKVGKLGDVYYMVCGSEKDKTGRILLFTSRDLVSWKFENVIYETDEFGGCLECPDLFPLNGKWILMFSAMRPTKAKTVFVTGDFDGVNFKAENRVYSEYGSDFYAPQTFDDNGARVMIGWLNHFGRPLPPGKTAAGAFSIPRELTLRDGRVCNFPVKSAQGLLTETCGCVRVDGTVIAVEEGGVSFARFDFKDVNGIKSIDDIKILRDGALVEIFVNGGLASFTVWLA